MVRVFYSLPAEFSCISVLHRCITHSRLNFPVSVYYMGVLLTPNRVFLYQCITLVFYSLPAEFPVSVYCWGVLLVSIHFKLSFPVSVYDTQVLLTQLSFPVSVYYDGVLLTPS